MLRQKGTCQVSVINGTMQAMTNTYHNNGLNSLPTAPTFKTPSENIVGKGENAGNQHFLLFPQCFLSFPK